MNKIISFLTGKNSVLVLIATLVILDFIVILSLFLPQILIFLIDNHLFEIVVITALLEILVVLSKNIWAINPQAFATEDEAQDKIKRIIESDNSIKSVKVLSAGISSRATLLRYLLELPRKLMLDVVTCFGEDSPNPDKLDSINFGPSHYNVIVHRLSKEEELRLKIFRSYNSPSFRCMLLCDSHGAKYGIVGWYTYHNRNTQIVGRRNIQLLFDRTNEIGIAMLRFSEKVFEENTKEPESVQIFPEESMRSQSIT